MAESDPIVQEMAQMRADLIDKHAAAGTAPSVEEVRAAIDRVWALPGDVRGAAVDGGSPTGSSRLVRSIATGLVEDLAKFLPQPERDDLLEDLAMISAG